MAGAAFYAHADIIKWNSIAKVNRRLRGRANTFHAPASTFGALQNRMLNANVVARHTSFDHTECCTGHTNLLSLVVAVVAATICSVQHSVALIDVFGRSSVSD